jgi:hypothetical protein
MTSEATRPIEDMRTELDAARAALLEAVTGLTDRDFASPRAVDGGEDTVLGLLVTLAGAERELASEARAAGDLAARPVLGSGGTRAARVLPPQVMHDLAGARHELRLVLDELGTEGVTVEGRDAALALLGEAARLERATATSIASGPAGDAAASDGGAPGGSAQLSMAPKVSDTGA